MGSLYALAIVLIIFFGGGLIDDAEDSLIEQSDLNMASASFAMEHKRARETMEALFSRQQEQQYKMKKSMLTTIRDLLRHYL